MLKKVEKENAGKSSYVEMEKIRIFNRKNVKTINKNENKEIIKTYTILFFCVSILVFIYFIFTNRNFIYKGDGVEQHYKALIYYSNYLKKIIKNLIFKQKLIIPNWDFNIGEGADIFATLQYYVIGDPFTALSIFVPTKFMHIFYNVMIIARLYIAGIAFILLCSKTDNKNRYGILAGTFSYVFCYWALYNANKHPYFLNPMIYFPLIILGIEKIIKKERPYFLIFSICIAALSNFYFFYMITILTAIYTIVRMLIKYKGDIKESVINIAKIGGYGLIATLLSGIIIIPICNVFLSDARMGVEHNFHLLYPLYYYSKLPSMFGSIATSYWTKLCTSVPALLSIFLLFKQKNKNIELKVLCALSFLVLLIPALAQIINGMSYISNRWSWACALLSSYILVEQWEYLKNIEISQYKYLIKCLIIYFIVCCVFKYSHGDNIFMRNNNWIYIFICIKSKK